MTSGPLIGVPGRRSETASGRRTPVITAGVNYVDSITRARGEPLVIAPRAPDRSAIRSLVARLDGLCLLGGADVEPTLYGARAHPETKHTDALLDRFEIAVIEAAIELDKPILAICRGLQVLNVALGGTLLQHVPDVTAEEHRLAYHEVTIDPGSRLASLVGSTVTTGHSVHHQALGRIASGLIATAQSPAGIVEAAEAREGWVVGVQWHPEDSAATDPQQQSLFEGLIRAASS